MKMKTAKKIPYEFVLEEIEKLRPYTKPMFGCTAVYVGDKILFVLRDRESSPRDNGMWLATTREHHASLKKDFPEMRSIEIFETKDTGWQVLPADSESFEDMALLACKFILRDDDRIGKVPKPKKPKLKARR